MDWRAMTTAAAVGSALLAGCTGWRPAVPATAYSAVQVIDTVPGPFVSRIYVSGERERQDALLGGTVVTSIIRRDLGVAWLLVPARQQYQEVPLADGAVASVQARCDGVVAESGERSELDGVPVRMQACHAPDGRLQSYAWVSADGIALRVEQLADDAGGKPPAVIRLEQLRIAPQESSLFELPPGHTPL